MTDFLIDGADKREGLPDAEGFDIGGECPNCKKVGNFHCSYGLAGGGFGPYVICLECDRVVAKTQVDESDC